MTNGPKRVVVITGAASGIGGALARTIAGADTALVLHTRKNESGLAAVAADCQAKGSEVETFLGDLANPDVPEALIGRGRERFGRVDQIVSNAGQAARSTFGVLTPEELAAAFASMPVAFLRMVNAGLGDLMASSCGRVVVVSSFVAHGFGTGDLYFPATSAANPQLLSGPPTLVQPDVYDFRAVPAGDYHLCAMIDADEVIAEIRETDNRVRSEAMVTVVDCP